MALDKLIAEVQHLPLSEDFADWQRGVLAAIPIYLRNQLHYHGWARDADLNDAAEVLGHRPKDLKVADRELVDFVRSAAPEHDKALAFRSEEHTSELQSLMRISYAVFCLKKKKTTTKPTHTKTHN